MILKLLRGGYMKSYNTEQRAMLTGFLKDNNESALSAEEIAEGLKEKYKEEAPGKSTVYRLLSRLCEEGSVKRFSSECKKENPKVAERPGFQNMFNNAPTVVLTEK